MTIRELRCRRAFGPANPEFEQCVQEHLPLVYGAAALLLPEAPGSVLDVTWATFEALRLRGRKAPRRTLVASWLVRTIWFIARRERRKLALPSPAAGSTLAATTAAFRKLNRLSVKVLDALVLRDVLRKPAEEAGRILRRSPSRVEKLAARGRAKIGKVLRKCPAGTLPDLWLGSWIVPVPAPDEERVLAEVRSASPKQTGDERIKAAVASWQWFGLRRLIRRLALSAVGMVGVLVLAGGTFMWLASRGYLTPFFIEHFSRNLLKEFPELAQRARPWPEPSMAAAVRQAPPQTAADLYVLTNTWTARLSFTRAAWRSLQPTHIPPANMHQPDGHLTLRNPNAHRNGLAGVIGLEFGWVEARLNFAGVEYPKAGVRYRGNGTYVNSLYGPKQSFKVDLNKFNKGQNLAGVQTLNFVNAIPDFSYMHDALAERFFRDFGLPAPRTAYAYLTVDAPGSRNEQPLGLYVLIENVDAEFALERFGSKKVPIFKPVTTELFKDLGGDWKAYAGIYDLKTKATPEQLERVIEFARLVTNAGDAEFAQRLPEYLDLREFAAFLAGHVLLSSYDGFLTNGQNFYMYLDPELKRFGFIPWDHDHAWGEFGYVATADKRERASIWQPASYDNHFLERVLKVEAFRSVYRQTLERAVRDLFTTERLYKQIDELAPVIRPAIAAESDFRLRRFDLAISTNWVEGARDGAPEGPKSPIHQIKRFIVNRVKSVQDQLNGTTEGIVLYQPRRQ